MNEDNEERYSSLDSIKYYQKKRKVLILSVLFLALLAASIGGYFLVNQARSALTSDAEKNQPSLEAKTLVSLENDQTKKTESKEITSDKIPKPSNPFKNTKPTSEQIELAEPITTNKPSPNPEAKKVTKLSFEKLAREAMEKDSELKTLVESGDTKAMRKRFNSVTLSMFDKNDDVRKYNAAVLLELIKKTIKLINLDIEDILTKDEELCALVDLGLHKMIEKHFNLVTKRIIQEQKDPDVVYAPFDTLINELELRAHNNHLRLIRDNEKWNGEDYDNKTAYLDKLNADLNEEIAAMEANNDDPQKKLKKKVMFDDEKAVFEYDSFCDSD